MTLFYANHRCKESVRQGISIYYTDVPIWIPIQNERAWFLFENVEDYDWQSHYQHRVARVYYCPFCGALLPEDDMPTVDVSSE